jgi:hypothetical protein
VSTSDIIVRMPTVSAQPVSAKSGPRWSAGPTLGAPQPYRPFPPKVIPPGISAISRSPAPPPVYRPNTLKPAIAGPPVYRPVPPAAPSILRSSFAGQAHTGCGCHSAASQCRCSKPIQAKTELERGRAHSRAAKCRSWMSSYGTCAQLNAHLRGHIFNGLPADGSARDRNNPSGFHAYTNGAAPAGIVITATTGNPGKVHTVTWRYNDSDVTKNSTMFPKHLSKEQVCSLILRRFNDWRANAYDQNHDAQCSYDAMNATLGFPNNPIEMNNPGDTVYPTGHR